MPVHTHKAWTHAGVPSSSGLSQASNCPPIPSLVPFPSQFPSGPPLS